MAKFTFDDFMKAKKEGRVRWDTDALNRDLEQTRGLLDSVSRQQTGGAKLWGYDDIEKNRKTVNDLSGRSAYLRAYINSMKGSKEYDELNEAYDQMSRGLRSAGQYLDARKSYVKPNSGTLAGDIEETMHPTLLGIDPAGYKKQAQARAADEGSKALYMSNKYGSSIKTLSDADKAKESAEDDEERKWLDGYKLSLAENMSDDEARKAYIGEKSDKNKAILKNRIARGEEKSRQKQYEGLSFGELMAEAQKPEKSSEESKWLKNRAYEIAADWDLAAYNEELRREYNKLNSPEYRVKHSEPGGYDAAEKRKAEILNEMEAVKQQRTVNQRNSSIEGYEKVKEKPDFEEKSAYRKVGGVYGGSDEARPDEGTGTYNYINTEKARTGEISRESIDYLDDEQRKVFNYLYNTEGADAAEDYIEALTPELNRRMTEANTSRAYNEGETNPAVASAVSVGTNLMSGFGIIEDIINSIGGRPIDVNSPAHLSANETTAYRGGVTSGIDKSMKGAGAPKWLQDVPSWGYQAGMSAIDSAVTMAAATLVTAGVGELAAVGDIALSADTLNTITSTTSSVIMGSQVATQTVIEAKNRGLSDDQAVTMGVLYGLVEGLSEKYSIETILKEPTSIRQMLMKSFIAEGSEEVVANWGDRLVDAMIERGSDQLTEEYNRLRKAGYSETQASLMVFWDCVKEDASAFLAGGLSGLAMSGAHAAVNKTSEGVSMGALKLAEKLAEKADYVSAAKEAMSSEGWDTVRFIDEAKEQAEEQGNKKALRLLENIDKTVYKHGVDKVSYADVANVLTLLDRGKSAEALGTSEQAPKDGKAQKKSNSAQAQGDGRAYSTVESKDGAEIRSYHFGESHKNGIIMKDAQGNTHTIVAVESSEAYHGERENSVVLRDSEGRSYGADELSASDSDINALLGIASSYRTRGAQALMANWESYKSHAEEQGREASLGEYQKYFFALYNAGVTGLDADTTQSSAIYRGAYSALGLRAARSATASGYNDGVQRFTRRARVLQKLRIPGLRRSIESRVYIPEGASVRLSDNTKALLDGVASRIGRDIVLDEGLDGSVNGLFDPTDGKLHLRADINDSYAVAAALHEAVHSIADVNPEGYEALRAFVMNYHALIGNDVEAMIELKGAEYGEKAPTREARIEEIVANTVMALAADEKALNRAIGIEKNKSLLEKVAEVIKELAQRVKRFIRENTTNEEAKAILDDAEALDMLAELFAQAADEAKENLSGMNEGAIEKENAHRGARYSVNDVIDEEYRDLVQTEYIDANNNRYSDLKFAVNDVIDEGYDAPLSDEEEQALWDEAFDTYGQKNGGSIFDGNTADLERYINENPGEALYTMYKSAQNTVQRAIRGFRQYRLGAEQLGKLSEQLMRDYEIEPKSNEDVKEDVSTAIREFIDMVEKGKVDVNQAVFNLARQLRGALTHSQALTEDPAQKELRRKVLDVLHGYKDKSVLVKDYQYDLLQAEYGSYNEFRRRMFGKLNFKLERNVTSIQQTPLYITDVVEDVLNTVGRINMEDQLYTPEEDDGFQWLEHTINEALAPRYINPWTDGSRESADSAALEMVYDAVSKIVDSKSRLAEKDKAASRKSMTELRRLNENAQSEFKSIIRTKNELIKTRSDKLAEAARQQRKLKSKVRELQRETKELEGRINKLKKGSDELRNTRNKLREAYEKQNEAMEKLLEIDAEQKRLIKDNYSGVRAEFNERQKLRSTVEGIRKIAMSMTSMIRNPTDTRYIPPEAINAGVYEAMEALAESMLFNPVSGRSIDIQVPGTNSKVAEKLDDLLSTIRKIKDEDGDFESEFNAEFKSNVEALIDRLKGKSISTRTLTLSDAREIYNIMQYVQKAIIDARKQIDRSERITNHESGQRIIEQSGEVKKPRVEMMTAYKSNFLNAIRTARMYSGYNDDAEIMYHVNELNRGKRKGDYWAMNAEKAFTDLTESKEYRRAYRRSLNEVVDVRYKTANGEEKTVRMTRMQGLSILMTWTRELNTKNMMHMRTSGIVLSDPASVKKGLSRLFTSETEQRIDHVNVSLISAIEAQMTDFEREYRRVAENYFNKVSREAINETMLKLKHREVARSKYYIPIIVDQNYLNKEFDALKFDATIEGRGSYKQIMPKATQPIKIVSLNQIVDRNIRETAQLYGMGVPIRNMKRAFKIVLSSTGVEGDRYKSSSVMDSLKEKFGKNAPIFFEHLMTDIEAPRRAENISAFSKMHQAHIASVLAANLSVVIKQAASYPTAGRYLNAKSLGRGLFTNYAKTVEEIDKYTASHYNRRIGMSIQEIADMQQSFLNRIPAAINPMKWIQGVDCLTTAALWTAAKDQVESEYKRSGKEMKTEEYWRDVTALYDKVIEDTQPMYDTLHRAEVQKKPSDLWKSVFLFSTQPLQNSGILYDALGEMIAKHDKQSRINFAKAVGSQFTSLVVFAGMTFLASMILHKRKRYRDEDGNVTLQSIIGCILSDMAQNGAKLLLPVGGDWLYSFVVDKLIKGKNFDILESAELAFINDIANSFGNLWNFVIAEGGNVMAGKEFNAEKWARTIADSICKAMTITGIPAENLKNMVLSGIGYARDLIEYHGHDLTDNSGQFTDEYLPSKIYNALIDGDVDKAKELEAIWRKELMAGGMSEEKALEKIKGKLVGKLTEDESVVAAAQSKYDGDYSAYDKARQRVIDLGFDEKDVDSAITRNYNKLNGADKTEKEAEAEGKTAFDDTGGKKFSKKDAFNALVRGDEKSFELARKYLEDNGVDEKELTSYMRSWSTTQSLWDRYFTAYQKSDSKTMKELKAVLVRIYGSEEEFKLKVSGKNGKGGYYEKWNERSIE